MPNSINVAPRIRLSVALALACALGLSLAQPAQARDHNSHNSYRDKGRQEHWNGNHGIEDRTWRHGRWLHGRYEGRLGWWWVTGNRWFHYNRPVYPYPVNPYAPRIVYAPPVVVTQPPEPSPGINLIFPLHIR